MSAAFGNGDSGYQSDFGVFLEIRDIEESAVAHCMFDFGNCEVNVVS